MNKEPVILSEAELNRLCKEWQEILSLQNWNMEVHITRARNMPLEECQGTCTINMQRAEAIINILDPVDYEDVDTQDMELTLVHELLHVHFQPFDKAEPGTLEAVFIERAIIQISKALVYLKRSSNPSISGARGNGAA